MKRLLIVTAMIEVGAGVALLCCPSAAVTLLLGSPLDTPAAVALGRVTGAALLALGVACRLAQYDAQSRAARGLVGGLLFYNAIVVAVLAYAGTALGLSSGGLWPAAAIHAAMTVWCVASLLRSRR